MHRGRICVLQFRPEVSVLEIHSRVIEHVVLELHEHLAAVHHYLRAGDLSMTCISEERCAINIADVACSIGEHEDCNVC